MTAVAGSQNHHLARLNSLARDRAVHLAQLYAAYRLDPLPPPPWPSADEVDVTLGAVVSAHTRGFRRIGLLGELLTVRGERSAVVAYLTRNALITGQRALSVWPTGVSPVDHAITAALTARRNAHEKMTRWRTWSAVRVGELADDSSARAVWRRIEPESYQASPRSPSPAEAAMLVHREAVQKLLRHGVDWPAQVYSTVFAETYVRARTAALLGGDAWLACVPVQRATLSRALVRVVQAAGVEYGRLPGQASAPQPRRAP